MNRSPHRFRGWRALPLLAMAACVVHAPPPAAPPREPTFTPFREAPRKQVTGDMTGPVFVPFRSMPVVRSASALRVRNETPWSLVIEFEQSVDGVVQLLGYVKAAEVREFRALPSETWLAFYARRAEGTQETRRPAVPFAVGETQEWVVTGQAAWR